MGANEKQAATYHGGAGVPVTEAVCERYMHDRHATDGIKPVRARAEFDRWLEEVRAEAKAEALEEAASEIYRLDGDDAEIYNEDLNATPVTAWLRARANQYKEEPNNGR